ncbi:hypothetical protein GOV09_01040 [Candidatus Woesearchaeota archaeon]|nr:hypothetical protein [Candidatus Woesearchaeota archaeon]
MNKISVEKLQKIKYLSRRGFSKRTICRDLKISKNTAIKYLGVDPSYKKSPTKFQISYTKQTGEIMGIFAGDGSQYFYPKNYQYTINVHVGKVNNDYLLYVKQLFEKHFQRKFHISEDAHTFRVRTYSKALFEYFSHFLDYDSTSKHSTVKLKIMDVSKSFKRGFVKGLFDTDGSILYKKKENRIRISFNTTSEGLARQVKTILVDFGYSYSYYSQQHKKWKKRYCFQLHQESVTRFLKDIRPFKAERLGW